MSATEETLRLLRSIDASLKTLVGQRGATTTQAPASVGIADDRDLDSQWGDEEVRVNPRDWTGEPMKGRRMSECPPAFLDMLAETLDYFAGKNEASNALTSTGKPKAVYDRKAAARARGWARRLRNGWSAPTMDAGYDAAPDTMAYDFATPTEADDDLPF